MFHKEVSASIVIEATPQQIWAILTDFNNYQNWNPFIVRAKGQAVEGLQFEGDFKPVGAKITTIRPTFKKVTPEQELRWLGTVGGRSLFAAEHTFTLEQQATGGVLVTQREKFDGLLVPFFKFDSSQAAFELMNQALKARAEGANQVRKLKAVS